MGNWQEVVADVAVGGVVGSTAQYLADRWKDGADRQRAFGVTAMSAGVLGLGLKLWSLLDGNTDPAWQDDIGDPLLTSGALVGSMVGIRAMDQRMQVVQPATVPDAIIAPDAYAAAVGAGLLPSGEVAVDPSADNPGYEVTAAQWDALQPTIPLTYDEATGLWDEASSTSTT